MFAKPSIGLADVALTVIFTYVLLVMVRAAVGVPIPMWVFPVALAFTGVAAYFGAGLGTAARAKGSVSGG